MPGTVSDPPTRLSSTWPLGTCPTADGQLWSPGDAGGVRGLGSLWPPSLALGTGFCPISRPLFPIRKTRNLDLFLKNYKISFYPKKILCPGWKRPETAALAGAPTASLSLLRGQGGGQAGRDTS